ncbi:hypothetical protein X743_27170 [Mesorhizobium sp. LNHC252B00]|uniref:hypothetical protein n=1 Tax=Mesorhizobium sp. LNHC252B00 TaxID=1287252 RepID=UPI0003CDFFE8|nr:hypothetical protein [Mesorhizobium sp. LNHC252B00]ESY67359.1 hypothetical protein X743_27170 [Mesorhizobium sp. LNHC252B00]
MNAGFGECYTLGGVGETPEWQEVMAKRLPYWVGDLPREVHRITCSVGVQKRSVFYGVRGSGVRNSSNPIRRIRDRAATLLPGE